MSCAKAFRIFKEKKDLQSYKHAVGVCFELTDELKAAFQLLCDASTDTNAVIKFSAEMDRLIEVANKLDAKASAIRSEIACTFCGNKACLKFTGKDVKLKAVCAFCLSQLLRELMKSIDDIMEKIG